jgi:hypothetical protein
VLSILPTQLSHVQHETTPPLEQLRHTALGDGFGFVRNQVTLALTLNLTLTLTLGSAKASASCTSR